MPVVFEEYYNYSIFQSLVYLEGNWIMGELYLSQICPLNSVNECAFRWWGMVGSGHAASKGVFRSSLLSHLPGCTG